MDSGVVDGNWSFAEPVVMLPTEAEFKAQVLIQRDERMAAVNDVTIGMSDAFVGGLLDEDGTKKFKAYAAYKLALNKIDRQASFPEEVIWPEYPAT
ncbi:hypothetical protein PspS04_09550 [Pseudomonas sp. S04]|nr:hypothetical protein PspS04_09550 [Pseudomonas sp. S04]QHF33088.1 hypothetical protein PspS19_09550 [Pseudomonas sp. S19]